MRIRLFELLEYIDSLKLILKVIIISEAMSVLIDFFLK